MRKKNKNNEIKHHNSFKTETKLNLLKSHSIFLPSLNNNNNNKNIFNLSNNNISERSCNKNNKIELKTLNNESLIKNSKNFIIRRNSNERKKYFINKSILLSVLNIKKNSFLNCNKTIFKNNKPKNEKKLFSKKMFKTKRNYFDILKEKKFSILEKTYNKIKYLFTREYFILPGNNSILIENVLNTRKNWKKISNKELYKFSNLIWSPISHQININNNKINNNDNNSERHIQFHNHIEKQNEISNKMKLFFNLLFYCDMNNINIFSFFPLTIILNLENEIFFNYNFNNFKIFFKNIDNYINNNNNNNENLNNNLKNKHLYSQFFSIYKDKSYNNGIFQPLFIPKTHLIKNIWLLKPSNLNRGRNIILCENLDKIKKEINFIKKNKQFQYLLLQKYIENVLLYNKRKFDIRIWVLVVFINNKIECFYFKEGHLKSSTENYNLNDNNIFIHLTNYSIQKYNNNFSKFEIGNEISFKEFQNFLGEKINFKSKILPNIIKIIKISINSVINKFNLINRNYCFEIFGYDFILDTNYVPYLLEINTNPGLEISSPLISKLIPRMIDDCFRLTIDKVFERDGEEDLYKNKSPFSVEDYKDDENMWEKII